MKITTEIGFCVCCGKPTPSRLLNKQELQSDLTLKSFDEYKTLMINKCEFCDYVGEDLSDSINPKMLTIVNSEEYQKILNKDYSYSFENKFMANNLEINQYDAYAYLCEKIEDYEKACLALFGSASLKEILIGNYAELVYTSPYDNDKYGQAVEELKQAREKDLYKLVELSLNLNNRFVDLLVCESLIGLKEIDKAKQLLNNIEIDESLKLYFENLIRNAEANND